MAESRGQLVASESPLRANELRANESPANASPANASPKPGSERRTRSGLATFEIDACAVGRSIGRTNASSTPGDHRSVNQWSSTVINSELLTDIKRTVVSHRKRHAPVADELQVPLYKVQEFGHVLSALSDDATALCE